MRIRRFFHLFRSCFKHKLRRWMNRPHIEDYLPYSTTHQHKPTWRVPFLAICLVNLGLVVIIAILLGNQAQFEQYVENNRANLCALLDSLNDAEQGDFSRGLEDLRCPSVG